MAKARNRSCSRYTLKAVNLLGGMVCAGRIARKLTAQELAARAGISRDRLNRIKKGEPRSELGATFEVAALAGVSLFELDLPHLQAQNGLVQEKLSLLPKAVNKSKGTLENDS